MSDAAEIKEQKGSDGSGSAGVWMNDETWSDGTLTLLLAPLSQSGPT